MPQKNPDVFWETREDWSRRKHELLHYYLVPAAAKLRSVSPDRTVIILDGYAGRGRYRDGSPGSPIHMGQLIDTCSSWKDPVDLRIFNVEADPKNVKELGEATRRWVEHGTVENFQGTFQDLLPTLLEKAGQSPLFAFLDPFAPSHLLFSDFLPLLERQSTTELCFVLHTPAILRMIRAAGPESGSSEEARRTQSATLDRVLGGSGWRGLLEQPALGPEEIAKYFAGELIRRATGSRRRFVCWGALEARYNTNLKYHVVLFTRHPEGVRLVNDAFCREKAKVYAAHSATVAPAPLSLFSPEELGDLPAAPEKLDAPARLERIVGTLLLIGREHPDRGWVRRQLVFECLTRLFGDFLEKEHLAGVKVLLGRTIPPRLVTPNVPTPRTGVPRTNDESVLHFEF